MYSPYYMIQNNMYRNMNEIKTFNTDEQDEDRFIGLPLLAGLAITAPFWAGRRCCYRYPYYYPVPTPYPYPYPQPYPYGFSGPNYNLPGFF
jgi:hypothetical protein